MISIVVLLLLSNLASASIGALQDHVYEYQNLSYCHHWQLPSLTKRAPSDCPSGYGYCYNDPANCCPSGGVCCQDYGVTQYCCRPGYTCNFVGNDCSPVGAPTTTTFTVYSTIISTVVNTIFVTNRFTTTSYSVVDVTVTDRAVVTSDVAVTSSAVITVTSTAVVTQVVTSSTTTSRPASSPSTSSQLPSPTSSPSVAPAPSPGTINTTVNVNDPRITTSGPDWKTTTSSCDSNKPCKQCPGANETLKFQFSGIAIFLSTAQSSNAGRYSVAVDGQVPVIVDEFVDSTNPKCQFGWSTSGLKNEPHSIIVTTLGRSQQANPSGNQAATFELDGITYTQNVSSLSATAVVVLPTTFKYLGLAVLFANTIFMVV